MRIKGKSGFVLPLILAVSGGAEAEPAHEIGVAAAVKDNVHGTVGGVTAPLGTGNNVYQSEVVATGRQSMAQLLFLDQTSLSVGPNSEVKLDRFVYDPDRKRGDVVLEASRGAFRFITGAQDPKSYTLKTPVATIGVRGTVLDYAVDKGKGSLTIRLVEGKADITLANGTVVHLEHPGDAVIILADGTVIGPGPWDGEIQNAVQGTSFPLYGWQYQGTPSEQTDKLSWDDGTQLTDELATHGISSITNTEPVPVSVSMPVPVTAGHGGGGSGGHECSGPYGCDE